MDIYDLGLTTDEICVFQYLQYNSANFISETEVARRADGRERFVGDSHWAHAPLMQLVDKHLLETDGIGRYRIFLTSREAQGQPHRPQKFIDPRLRSILEHSDHHFDLSCYS